MIKAILAFLGISPFALYIAAALLTGAGLVGVKLYNAGYASMEAKCETAALKAKIAKLELEIKTQKDADAAEDRLKVELEAENAQLQKVIDAYAEELKKRPDKCLLGDDAGRLNGLR